jgi:hypothetical protein
LSANEPQTLRDECFWATKTLDVDYKPASLDDIIKTCENLHIDEQHQIKTLHQKYEHLFDGTLGEFNMEQKTIFSECSSPPFAIPKKNITIGVFDDFSKLN